MESSQRQTAIPLALVLDFFLFALSQDQDSCPGLATDPLYHISPMPALQELS